MNANRLLLTTLAATLLVTWSVSVDAYQANASVSVLACSGTFGDSDGGSGVDTARAAFQVSGECGPTPDDDATAIAAGIADLATGFAYVYGLADGVVGANRATSSATFIDQLYITNVPAGVDSVTVEAALDLVADYGGTFDFANELLSGTISISSVGQINIRRCNIVFCPNDPIQSDSATQVFVVERSQFTNEFPVIDVRIDLAYDVANSGGYFSGKATVEIIDGSGAVLDSDSGVFGTGTMADDDFDGVPNALDNCTTYANGNQRDTNDDGFGNVCDADIVDDCSVNFADLAVLKAAFHPGPYDPHADLSGDGFVAFGDLARFKETFFTSPNPGPGPSGVGNACFP